MGADIKQILLFLHRDMLGGARKARSFDVFQYITLNGFISLWRVRIYGILSSLDDGAWMFAKGLHSHTAEDAGGSRGAGVSQSLGERELEWRDSLVSSIQAAIFPKLFVKTLCISL